VDQQLEAAGRSCHVALSKPTFLGAPFIVQDTDLLSTLPEKVPRGFTKFTEVELFDCSSRPWALEPFDVVLLWHDRTHTNPVHRLFRELIVSPSVRAF